MLPGIHYAGLAGDSGDRVAGEQSVRRDAASCRRLSSGLIRPAVDLFLFVRNKLRDLRFASLEELPHERITVHLLEQL